MTAELEHAVSPRSKITVRRYLFALILAGLAVYFFLPRFAAMGRALQVISNLRISFVTLSIAAQVLSYVGSGYLLRTVVRLASKPISIVDGALMTAGANSVGTLGGGVIGTAGMAYLWLRRRGVNAGAAGIGGWLPILLNNTVLAIVSLAGLIIIIYDKKSSGVIVLAFALILLILGGTLTSLLLGLIFRARLRPAAIAVAGFFGRFRNRPSARIKVEAAVGHLLEGWDALLQGGWRGPAVGAVFNTGFDMLTLYFLFLAAGHQISAAVLVAGYGIPQLLGKLTVVLGGVGVVEASMVGLYALLGAPRPTAAVVVLAYRLLSFWLPTLIGLAFIPYLERYTGLSGGPISSGESTRQANS